MPKTDSEEQNNQTMEFLWERLEAERQKLDQAEQMNQALVASIGEGIIVSDEYGDITTVNQVALEMLGFEREDLVGQWLPKVLPSLDKEGNPVPTAERPAVRALLTGKPNMSVVSYAKKDGTHLPIASTAAPFLIDSKPKGVIIVFRDLTREIQIERAKDEFISITSHQLSTPLTAVQLFTKLLSDDSSKLTDTQREYLDKIEVSVDRMLHLVHDFLNVSRLELGALKPSYMPVDIAALAKTLVKEVSETAKDKGVKISTRVDVPETVMTDAELLSQVIQNLLTNAVRYSPPKVGKVTFAASLHRGRLLFKMSDNGIGIPEDAKPKIYSRLFRADNAEKVEASGTGLGLYLVKKIVEAMNGQTWFESKLRNGTTFFVELPVPPKVVSKFTEKAAQTK